ncbi:MAG: acyl-ACP--UDP-N-acetylglucosamine O-acyltransferase [Candidatus Eremiobacteraeota bacterium]|nr:acyl-ACP--UDP-N-acetylglucosamine O-acyltransferase [Candidatus Eremiobacteraeota bacterium]
MANIHPSAIVDPSAQIAEGAEIGPFSIIHGNVTIGAGTKLHSSVVVGEWTEIGENNEIFPGAVIGVAPQDLRYSGERAYTKIGNRNVIREYVTIHRASDAEGVTSIGDDNLLMAYTHVAHNCILGNQIVIANSVGIAGHVEIEDQAVLGGMCGLHQFVRVGKLAMLGGMAQIRQDIPPYAMVDGQPARVFGMNIRGMQRRGIDKDSRQALKSCYRLILQSGLNLTQAINSIKANVEQTDEVAHLVKFLESPSKMGVCIREPDHRRERRQKARPLKVQVEAANC